MAKILVFFLVVVSVSVSSHTAANIQQASCGVFLKLHIMEKTVRRAIVPIHSVIGKAFPLLGWTRTSRSVSFSPLPSLPVHSLTRSLYRNVLNNRNAVWRRNSPRILPRRSPRTMRCALYHGQRIYRVCRHTCYYAQCRRRLVEEKGM